MSDAMMITEFLVSRISEDEASHSGAWPLAMLTIVERHGPVRDDKFLSLWGIVYWHCMSCHSPDGKPEAFPCPTLRALAAIYSDHPDYRGEWAL